MNKITNQDIIHADTINDILGVIDIKRKDENARKIEEKRQREVEARKEEETLAQLASAWDNKTEVVQATKPKYDDAVVLKERAKPFTNLDEVIEYAQRGLVSESFCDVVIENLFGLNTWEVGKRGVRSQVGLQLDRRYRRECFTKYTAIEKAQKEIEFWSRVSATNASKLNIDMASSTWIEDTKTILRSRCCEYGTMLNTLEKMETENGEEAVRKTSKKWRS